MPEILQKCNGFFLTNAGWNILLQLDEEDMAMVLHSYMDYLKNYDWDKAYQDLCNGAQRCGFCFLCEYAEPGYREEI